MRTALSQFSFALVVLKIFTSEFYAIGALFAVYGAAVMLVAIFRRYEGNRQFFSTEEEVKDQAHAAEDAGERQRHEEGSGGPRPDHLSIYTHTITKKKFRTSGTSVALLSALSMAAYIALIVLVLRLKDQ